jgi:putative heme-binding domain-containing protein
LHIKLKLLVSAAACLLAAVVAAQQPGGSSPATAGEGLFFGKAGCAGCHEVNGRGGVTGPDLSAAGTRSPEALVAKIRNPNNPASTVPGGRGGPSVVIVKMKDAREIRGVRRNEDTFSLQMVDASGQLHLLDKRNLSEVRNESRSLMPADYSSRLSEQELQSVVAYLGTLKERDINKTALANITWRRDIRTPA